MIDIHSGEVFGIKGYGMPHKGHRYGNVLDGTAKPRSRYGGA
jgi:hypothetical protein